MQLLFGFEYIVLAVSLTTTFIKYLLNAYEGMNFEETWASKTIYIQCVNHAHSRTCSIAEVLHKPAAQAHCIRAFCRVTCHDSSLRRVVGWATTRMKAICLSFVICVWPAFVFVYLFLLCGWLQLRDAYCLQLLAYGRLHTRSVHNLLVYMFTMQSECTAAFGYIVYDCTANARPRLVTLFAIAQRMRIGGV
jgi:hypothetical protein